MLPNHPHLVGAAETGLEDYIREFMAETNWMTWIGVVASSIVFMLTPVLTIGYPVPAILLSAKSLDKHAHRLASHRIYLLRQSTFIVKMLAGFCWGSSPQIRQQFNLTPYPPDPGTWRTS